MQERRRLGLSVDHANYTRDERYQAALGLLTQNAETRAEIEKRLRPQPTPGLEAVERRPFKGAETSQCLRTRRKERLPARCHPEPKLRRSCASRPQASRRHRRGLRREAGSNKAQQERRAHPAPWRMYESREK